MTSTKNKLIQKVHTEQIAIKIDLHISIFLLYFQKISNNLPWT